MSRIEELPDDYDEPRIPIKLHSQPSPPSAQNGAPSKSTSTSTRTPPAPSSADASIPIPIPDLPPHLSGTHTQTVDEAVADLKRSPFFMTSLSDAGNEDNPELEAIKALLYEGTRLEIASNFREQGNEQARAKIWTDGKELYTKGLAALKAARKEGDPWGEEEDGKERGVREVLLVNRALCHLELGNLRSCALDCRAALEVNARNVKAFYRMACAMERLGKWDEARAAATAGVGVDPENKPLKALLERVRVQMEKAERKERERLEGVEREKKIQLTLATALKARKISTRGTGGKPELPDDAVLKLTPDPLSMTSTLVFPVILLYPLHAQSDVIKAFGEEQTLAGHLEYLLPLPWDTRGEYTMKSIEAYLETKEGGLVKWGKNVELLRVLSGGKVEVVDGLVRINVVPKDRAGEWIAELKRRKGKK
ncbi:MAG: hypothetical protein MMC23_006928 [Stictis urceolatum]|nr:hypothetical protein [Stictis urceolata]